MIESQADDLAETTVRASESHDAKAKTTRWGESLKQETVTDTEHKTKPFSDVQFLKEIHMGMDSDQHRCITTDMCQMKDGTILVLDEPNRRLKRLDDKYNVVDFYECKYKPLHVVVVSSSEVVVLIEGGTLQFITINGHEPMVCKKEVRLDHRYRYFGCFGMVYCNDQIWIGTRHGGICIYNLSGSLMKTIKYDSLGAVYFHNYPYPPTSRMATNKDKTRVYVISNNIVDILDKYGGILRNLRSGEFHPFHPFQCITETDEDLLLMLDYVCRSIEMYDVAGGYLGQLDVNKKLLSPLHPFPTSILYDRKNRCLIVSRSIDNCFLLQLNR